MENEARRASNFIEETINQDLASGRFDHVKTRFPPEPNGYLHIGHAKALCVDFGTARKYGGSCNLRFDDTNPAKEEKAFVEGIQADIEWLGFKWDNLYFASDFFDRLYEIACSMIRRGLAYVDDQSPEEMRKNRGTLTQPGVNSPYRDRTPEENLDLFQRMKAGEFPDGSRVLRAKIDMAAPNVLLRDPTMYRIKHMHHHRAGDKWCIYPMYDFQHPVQDAIEGITHSLCSLEYEIHRPLYDWVVNVCGFEQKPRQIEFARLNIERTVMSKRYLRRMVEEGVVSGWDDPRMPTLVAMRRRGYPAIAVLDFMEEPVKKFFRLAPGKEVRLKGAYIIKCEDFVKDESGNVVELKCTVDLDSRSGSEGANRKVKGTLHWVSAIDAVPCEMRLYEPILSEEVEQEIEAAEAQELDEDGKVAEAAPAVDFMSRINPNSLTVCKGFFEPYIAHAEVGTAFQFLRMGYFCKDKDSTDSTAVFNRVVPLKDSYKPE